MGRETEPLTRSLTNQELSLLTRALELALPSDAIVKAECWPGASAEQYNYRVTMWTAQGALEPLRSTWLVERRGRSYRLRARPASLEEIELLLDVLRELGELGASVPEAIAEAEYDCSQRTYQLCFTPLQDMHEGSAYRRWIFRRHSDARPLSVGYLCETRRGDEFATLPGGGVLRGSPWSD